MLIFGAYTTAMNMYPYNMYFQFTGITGWLIVGIMWRDWALIVVNTIGSLILLIGIIDYHFYTDWMLRIYENQYIKNITSHLMVKILLFMLVKI